MSPIHSRSRNDAVTVSRAYVPHLQPADTGLNADLRGLLVLSGKNLPVQSMRPDSLMVCLSLALRTRRRLGAVRAF